MVFAKVLGELDFFRTAGGGEGSLEGDTLPERSSDVTARLALWELSDRSLQTHESGLEQTPPFIKIKCHKTKST